MGRRATKEEIAKGTKKILLAKQKELKESGIITTLSKGKLHQSYLGYWYVRIIYASNGETAGLLEFHQHRKNGQ